MLRYTARRIVYAIPVLLGILIVIFALARMIPGEPCKAILGEKASAETCERFNREHGLDKPIPVQFGIYLGNVLQGELGNSIRFARPVTLILVERLPTTIELTLFALIIAMAIGIPAGVISAVRHNSPLDVATMVGANVGVSMPVFWLGLMLAYLFAILLKDTPFWLPPSGRLTPGLFATPFYEAWGWGLDKQTPIFKFWEFFANLYVLNSILTRNWELLVDTIKHLLLPANI